MTDTENVATINLDFAKSKQSRRVISEFISAGTPIRAIGSKHAMISRCPGANRSKEVHPIARTKNHRPARFGVMKNYLLRPTPCRFVTLLLFGL
jgi:hypothetical protein